MNKETNHIILKKVVTQLPIYKPPNELWSAIDNELDLHKRLQALQNHQPKEFVWKAIETNLVKDISSSITINTNTNKTSRTFLVKRLSIAASILFILGISWWIMTDIFTQNKFQYTQETIDRQLLLADWDEDGEVLTQIKAICENKNYACTAPEFQQLEQELNELNEAKSDLKQAIDDFGKDTQLIAKLSEIELERTVVLKKMIANIL